MHQLLKKSIEISDKMLVFANTQEWQEIFSLSQKRDRDLRAYFNLSPRPDDQQTVSKAIEKSVLADQKICEIISLAKSHMIDEGLTLKNNHAAIQQYHITQTG